MKLWVSSTIIRMRRRRRRSRNAERTSGSGSIAIFGIVSSPPKPGSRDMHSCPAVTHFGAWKRESPPLLSTRRSRVLAVALGPDLLGQGVVDARLVVADGGA